MSFDGIDIVSLISVIFGCWVAVVFIHGLFKLLRTWINRNNKSYDQEKFDRLAKAFIRFKKETECRMKQIESDYKNRDARASTSGVREKTKHGRDRDRIEMEPNDTVVNRNKKNTGESGTLKNMLNEE
jgi:hypothetical protein